MKLIDSPYGLSLTQDRRQDRRQKMDGVTYLNVERDNGGILLDLSEGGMCISVANPLAKSAQIQFSLWIEENRSIEGTGQVCWLSESGRSAGVRFLSVQKESREKIRECLAGSGFPVKKTTSDAATETAATTPSPSQALARPETHTPPPATHTPETPGKDPALASPLFFLPKKREPDEVSTDHYSSPEQTYTWHPENASENDADTVVAYRSAITSTAEPEEEEDEENRQSNKALLAATVFFALLAVSVAAVMAYPSKFSQLRQFAASLTVGPADTTPAPVEAPRPRRVRNRRVARPRVPSGPQRGSRAVRDVESFYAPRSGQTALPVQVTGYDQQRWLATATSRRFVPTEAQPSSPDTNATSSNYGSIGKTATNSPAPAPTGTATSSSPEGTESLRVDGGLVEEGAVSPTFSPLNLDGQTLVAKPIVVEAVIGKDGGVKDVRLVSSPASNLAQAVVSAVKLWRYRPFYRNGRPVEFVTRITFDFSLPNGNMH